MPKTNKIQITEDTSIVFLYAHKEISYSLYKTMLAFKVKTLHDAFSFIETELISREHRNELKKIKDMANCHITESRISNDCLTNEIENRSFRISYSTSLDTLFSHGLLSVRLFHCLKQYGLNIIGDVVELVNTEDGFRNLLSLRNFGQKSLMELKDVLAHVEADTTKSNEIEDPTKIVSQENLMDDFIIKYNELIKIDIYKSAIENYYKNCRQSLSIRAVHALDKGFSSVLDILCLYYTNLNITLKHYGEKTSKELKQFVLNLYDGVSSIIAGTNNEEVQRQLEISQLKTEYPFLQDKEIEFVIDFKHQNSHLPMFYLLYHFVIRDNGHFTYITRNFYGIGTEPKELDEISYNTNLSRERCRQILFQNCLKDSSIITSKEWSNYDCLDEILLYNTFYYQSILEPECLGDLSVSAFAGLCSLLKQIDICKIRRNSPRRYYLSRNLCCCFDFKGCLRDIENTLNKRCTQDIVLPISTFIDSYWLNEPTFCPSQIEDVIIRILIDDYGIHIGEDKALHIQQNAIDRKEEIYKILEENGAPLHISQIVSALMLRNDELSNVTIEQIKADIQRHPEIVALGKSSSYALKEWNLYTGTIRDLLYDILSNESTPICIAELYKKVSQIYPNTSIKSITSTMASDEQERFVRFEDLYYGIVGKIYPEEYIVWDIEEHSKKTFEERLREFESFLKSHRHLPRSGSEIMEEASLWRWYKRVIGNDIFISEEQRKKFSKMLNKNKDCVVTGIEYSFYRYCEEFKAYIEDNMEFPTHATDSAKYTWFMANRKIYKEFEDRRKIYFEELIEYLHTYGFEV